MLTSKLLDKQLSKTWLSKLYEPKPYISGFQSFLNFVKHIDLSAYFMKAESFFPLFISLSIYFWVVRVLSQDWHINCQLGKVKCARS